MELLRSVQNENIIVKPVRMSGHQTLCQVFEGSPISQNYKTAIWIDNALLEDTKLARKQGYRPDK